MEQFPTRLYMINLRNAKPAQCPSLSYHKLNLSFVFNIIFVGLALRSPEMKMILRALSAIRLNGMSVLKLFLTFEDHLKVISKLAEGRIDGHIVGNDIFLVPGPAGVREEVLARTHRWRHGLQNSGRCRVTLKVLNKHDLYSYK